MRRKNTTRKRSQFVEVWKRFKRNKLAVAALAVVLIVLFASIFADVLAPYDYTAQDYTARFAYPSKAHLMGTDNFGRDLFSRILKGGQVSLLVAFGSVGAALVAGGILGATAAYFGGAYGNTVMRIMDVILSIPGFLLAVAISAALGTGIRNSIIAIGISFTPAFARIMQAAVITVKDEEFVEAAIASGAKHGRVIFKYIVPNTLSTLIVNATIRMGGAIMQISSLSFIGLGVQPPAAEWGSILSVGRQYIRDFCPFVVFPGLAIIITLIALNLLGDGLRDALDPKLKQ